MGGISSFPPKVAIPLGIYTNKDYSSSCSYKENSIPHIVLKNAVVCRLCCILGRYSGAGRVAQTCTNPKLLYSTMFNIPSPFHCQQWLHSFPPSHPCSNQPERTKENAEHFLHLLVTSPVGCHCLLSFISSWLEVIAPLHRATKDGSKGSPELGEGQCVSRHYSVILNFHCRGC